MQANVSKLVALGRYDEAIEVLSGILDDTKCGESDRDELLFARGKIYWRLGKRADAMNDYMAALRLNPNSKARMALEQAQAVEGFYNKDLYNP